jgi:2-keto-3-deoxy-L-rhamnonate aldolase RhmA
MGHPGEYDHPTVKKGIAKVLAACKKHGVPFGTTASGPAAAKQWVKKGCRFFEIIDELTMIKRVSAETVDAYHKFC